MSTLGRALKNTAALSAAEILGKALNFVLMAVLARQLTPEDFGGYTTVLSLVWFLVPLSDLGISQVLTRETAADKGRAGVLLFNGLLVTGSLGVLGGLGMIVVAAAGRYPASLRPWIALASLAVLANVLTQSGYAVLRGLERMEIQAFASSMILIGVSAGGILLAWMGRGVEAQVILFVSTAIGGAIFTLGLLGKRILPWETRFDALLCRKLVRLALPISVLIFYSVALRWSDILILGQTRSMDDVAVYGTAQKVIDLANVVSASASAALFPLLAHRWRVSTQETHRLFLRALRFFADFGVGAAAGIAILAEPIVTLLFGGLYAPAAAPLRLLAWAFLFQVVSGPTGTLLIATGERLRKFVPVIGGIVALNIVLNITLTPRWGYLGSAWAFLATAAATFAVRQWIAAEHFARPPRVGSLLWRPVLAAAGMAGALWAVQPGSVFVSIVLGALVYFMGLFLLGEHRQEPYPDLWKALREARR